MHENYVKIAKENLKINENKIQELIMKNKVGQCSSCGEKLEYRGLGKYECPVCKTIVKDDYGKVRDYLDEHGPTNAYEISQATGVEKDTIDYLLKSGRLEITEDSKVFLQCEMCGAYIRSGRICAACANKSETKMMGYSMGDVGDRPRNPADGKMHFIRY